MRLPMFLELRMLSMKKIVAFLIVASSPTLVLAQAPKLGPDQKHVSCVSLASCQSNVGKIRDAACTPKIMFGNCRYPTIPRMATQPPESNRCTGFHSFDRNHEAAHLPSRKFVFQVVADDANFPQILPSEHADDEEAHQAGSTSEIGFGGGAGCHAPKS